MSFSNELSISYSSFLPLILHMDNYGYDALTTIRTKGVLDEAAENTLKAALAVLNERFVSVS